MERQDRKNLLLGVAAVIAAALLIVALTGCGPSEAEKRAEAMTNYAQAVNDVQDKHGAKIGAAATSTPTAATFKTQAAELDAMRRDLNALRPIPTGARAQHEQLEGALARAASEVRAQHPLSIAMESVRAAVVALNQKIKALL